MYARRPVNKMAALHTSGGVSPERQQLLWDQEEKAFRCLERAIAILGIQRRSSFLTKNAACQDMRNRVERRLSEINRYLNQPGQSGYKRAHLENMLYDYAREMTNEEA